MRVGEREGRLREGREFLRSRRTQIASLAVARQTDRRRAGSCHSLRTLREKTRLRPREREREREREEGVRA